MPDEPRLFEYLTVDDHLAFTARMYGVPDAASRARALLDGRLAPSIDDVIAMAEPVLKHRMALTFAARADGETVGTVIGKLTSRLG